MIFQVSLMWPVPCQFSSYACSRSQPLGDKMIGFLGDRLQNGLAYAIGPLSLMCGLSVALVNCGQMVVWIKMKRGMQVGIGPPDHLVLDRDPAPPKRGTAPSNFWPCLLWPNGWMDQDATWYGGRPRTRRHCVRWGPSSPP